MSSPADAASLFGAIHEDIQYKLTITDVKDDLLRVAAYTGIEELSQLFAYTITVSTDPDAESIAGLEAALGRDATFTIEKDGKAARIVHGIVTGVQADGTFIGKTQARVAIVLEPRMANLRYSGGFRIFQDLGFHEIVNTICEPEHVDVLYHVHGVPAKRTYCTQFDESDLEFIARIASEEGMHFFFQHDEKKTTLIFSNDYDGYVEVEKDLKISFNDTIGAIDDEHVRSIRRGQSVRTGALEHRDYDFLAPKRVLVARTETKGKETTANSHKRERRDYPGRFTDKDGPGKNLAEMRLEELRSDAFTLSGTALSLRLHAGYTFKHTGHHDEGFNRKLLLTSVKMEGHVQGSLNDGGGFRASNELALFSAVPAEAPIHPERIAKPGSRLQSARVVGPNDGDPYVDEQGRVKVQFFWDRDGKFDEKSSCWIRMMTPVAHLDEGFWQAHKVGSEVVVGFMDDDIDRPMILGAVYNSVQQQLYPLPAKVAKSVWRTNSIPGGGTKAFNEITQDNTAGAEEIYIHAQKDRRTVVLHNHNETIGANQSTTVGANQSITAGANRSVTVGANESIAIGAHRHETVEKGEDVTIKQGRQVEIETGNESLEVTVGNREVKVCLKDTFHSQSKVDTIDTTYDIAVGTSITIHHGKDSTLVLEEGKASLTTNSEILLSNPSGSIKLAGGKIEISAANELVLGSGTASMTFTKDGSIGMKGPTKIEASSAQSFLKLEPPKATLSGPMTDVVAKAIAKVMGALVKIN